MSNDSYGQESTFSGETLIPLRGKIAPVESNPALPTTTPSFGCEASTRGYAKAVAANGPGVKIWPCLIEPGKACARLYDEMFK